MKQHDSSAAGMSSMWGFGGLGPKDLVLQTLRRARANRIFGQSAKMSFYFLLSIFPLLLFLVALLGMLLQSQSLPQNALHEYLSTVLPGSASSLVDSILKQVRSGSDTSKLSFALIFLWWSAVQGMRAVIEGLNVAYDAVESRPWWKKIALASVLTVVLMVLLAGALLLMIYGRRFSELGADRLGLDDWVLALAMPVRWLLVLACALTAFNITYLYGPNIRRHGWHWLMPGTVVGVVLWIAASLGFQLYLRHFDHYSATYGSIGAVIILLLWFYLSGTAFLIGAELNAAIEKASGTLDEERRDTETEKSHDDRDSRK